MTDQTPRTEERWFGIPGEDKTPATEAGRRFFDQYDPMSRVVLDDILAIEAQARAEALDVARAFLDHVTEAATWPTPGIGCDGKCKEADALRAILADGKA